MADSANDHALDSTLKPICSRDPSRPRLHTPFGMDYEKRRWTAATDGHIFVALVGPCDLRTDAPPVVDQLLMPEPAPTHRASVALLKEWAGSPSATWTVCETCNGFPTFTHCPACGGGPRCDGCRGAGAIANTFRPGALLGGVLNRILLAKVLATLPEGAAHIFIGQRAPLMPYMLRAKDWIAAVMPLRDASADTTFERLEAA